MKQRKDSHIIKNKRINARMYRYNVYNYTYMYENKYIHY